eukprot:2789461-Prymnesium_polylepis.2
MSHGVVVRLYRAERSRTALDVPQARVAGIDLRKSDILAHNRVAAPRSAASERRERVRPRRTCRKRGWRTKC